MIRFILALGTLGAILLWLSPEARQAVGIGATPDCRASLREVAQAVLQPLEAGPTLAERGVAEKLRVVREQLAARPNDPSTRRTAQALALIENAMRERAQYVNRANVGSAENPLDHVPGDW